MGPWGQIRPYHRDETWSVSLWQTFFTSCVGANIPTLTELSFSVLGDKKFQLDHHGDQLCTCTTHSDVNKAHDWVVDQITDLFRTKHNW
jgi:hypothetical protein